MNKMSVELTQEHDILNGFHLCIYTYMCFTNMG